MKKFLHLSFVFLSYALAYVGGYFSSIWIANPILQIFFADVVATVIIYIISLFLKNTSLYDPYWSITPLVIALYFMIRFKAYSIPSIILVAAIGIYAIRLTVNWIITFTDFSYQDWRYKKYREQYNKVIFEFINFFGLMMFPTVLVYGGCLPMIALLMSNATSWWSMFGVAIVLLGVALEFFADHQVHKFLRETTEKKVCQVGLWNYSRHPNYLGENLIWFGLFIAMIPVLPEVWYYGFGFVAILLLFLFISIPLMEKRQKARRPDYIEYIKTTSMFLILPKKKAR